MPTTTAEPPEEDDGPQRRRESLDDWLREQREQINRVDEEIAQDRRRMWFRAVPAFIVALVAGFAAVSFLPPSPVHKRLETQLDEMDKKLQRVMTENRAFQQRLHDLDLRLVTIPAKEATLANVSGTISALDRRLNSIEEVMIDTPAKAVALPLLKKDLDGLQERSKADLESVRDEVSRTFTLLEWLVGLVVTIFVGVSGLMLANWKKSDVLAKSGSEPHTKQSKV